MNALPKTHAVTPLTPLLTHPLTHPNNTHDFYYQHLALSTPNPITLYQIILSPFQQPTSQPTIAPSVHPSAVFVVCTGAGGSRGWYTGYIDHSSDILYGLELQTANFVLADPTMSSCYSLVQTTATYTSTGIEATDQTGYLQTVTNQYGAVGSVAVTDWATLTDAISVVGLQKLFSFFSCAATDSGWGGGAGADCFFTLNNGVAVQSGTRNYFTSFFKGTNAPGWYAVMNGPVTDGTYAAVLGSFPNTLSVGGKITGFKLATASPSYMPTTPVVCPAGQYYSAGSTVCTNCPDVQSSVAGGPCLDTCTSSDTNCGVALKSGTGGACVCASCNDGSIPSIGTSCPVSSCYGSTDTNSHYVSYCTCTTVVFPPGLRAIADYAFQWCYFLNEVTIPGTVTSIGNYAFGWCSQLSEVTIPSSVISIGSSAFRYVAAKSITIPSGVTSIGDYAFNGCYHLATVTIQSGVTRIGNGAFQYCPHLSFVSIPLTVTSIGYQAFSSDSLLTSVNVPAGVSYNGGTDPSQSFDCTAVSPTPSSTFLGTICSGPTTTVITATTPNGCSCPAGQYYPADSTVCTNCPAGTSSDGVGGSCINCPGVQSSVAGGLCVNTCTSSDTNCGVALLSGVNNACVCASCNDGSVATSAGCPVSSCYGAYPTSTCTCTTAVFPPGLRVIARLAFSTCPITTSVIPSAVTSIGNYAFYLCSALTKMFIPSGVTIGDYAFNGCTHLSWVTIASGVTGIGQQAFYGCTSLSCVSIPQTVTLIGNHAFTGDSSLATVNVPAGVSYNGGTDPSSVSSSFDCTPVSPTPSPTFLGTICSGLTTTVITATTPNICSCPTGQYFAAGSTVCTNCPAGTSSDGVGGPCTNCPGVQSSVAGGLCLNTCTSTDTNCGVALKSGDNCVCASCNDGSVATDTSCPVSTCYRHPSTCTCTTAVFPPGLRVIADLAFGFYSCPFITTAVIPDTVISIGNGAFYGCRALTEVTIPSSVTSIGEGAFYYCDALPIINIPHGVTTIGTGAFGDCHALNEVTIPDTVTHIGSLFYGCHALTTITIPDTVTSIGNYAFSGCTALNEVTILGSVTIIGDRAFYGCYSLSSVSIPLTVTSIGNGAFYYNSLLTTINVPAGISYNGGSDPSQSFLCTPVSPTPSPTFLGTICRGSTTTVITTASLVTTPAIQPSGQPSRQPSVRPTLFNINPKAGIPTGQPTRLPSRQPTRQPTHRPSIFNANPKAKIPTGQPSESPSKQPSQQPTRQPTVLTTTALHQQQVNKLVISKSLNLSYDLCLYTFSSLIVA